MPISRTFKTKFSRAIVRTPCRRIVDGLASAARGKPDYDKAVAQHSKYVEALQTCGLRVAVLPADERFPDSTFLEDTAVLTPDSAIVTHPGAESRRGETAIVREVLSGFYPTIDEIIPPGTVEGGDVMRVGGHFYIGLSKRTNEEGADQLIRILRRHGMDGTPIRMKKMLHLKTGVNYIERNTLLVAGEFLKEPAFRPFKRIRVDSKEADAANCLWVNGTVLVPEGFPVTRARIESAGYKTITVDVSEFRKIDGGLSCLSLRF